jgi:hypothetical protein
MPVSKRALLTVLLVALSFDVFHQQLSLAESMDVTNRVTIQRGGMVFNRATNTFDMLTTLTNVSEESLQGSLAFVLSIISAPGVALANPSGFTAEGKPFLAIPVQASGLTPGNSVQLLLKFKNPERVAFTFTHIVMVTTPSGTGIAAIGVTPASGTVGIGKSQVFEAVATNASGNPIPAVNFLWTSSDPTVANVSGSGLVVGLAAGITRITAFADGVTSSPVELTVITQTGKTSLELIDEAVTNGTLNEETALIYKIFVVFGDSRLPMQFRGEESAFEATSLIHEITARWKTLSTAAQDILRPFFIPPYYQGSWHDLRMNATAQNGHTSDLALVPSPLQVVQCGGSPPFAPFSPIWECLDGHNVRIWWLKSALHPDRTAEDRMKAETLRAAIDSTIEPKLTSLMGRGPLSDAAEKYNGGDGRLDIGLVDSDFLKIPAVFTKSDPEKGCQAPYAGYILVNRNNPNKFLVPTIVHEYMHAVLSAYKVKTGCTWPEYIWLDEATANWSIDFVYPDIFPQQDDYEQGYAGNFLNYPQQPLEFNKNDHDYGAYIFLFYLARGYSPQYIPSIWEQTEQVANSLQAINQALIERSGGKDFKFFWPEFVLRNWNQKPVDQYEKWDQLRYGAVTVKTSVTGGQLTTTKHSEDVQLDQGQYTFPLDAPITHLSARYYHFKFPDNAVRSVSFDAEALLRKEPTANIRALIKVEGEDWQDPQDWTELPPQAFCRDMKKERLEELVIIISNTEWQNRGHDLKPDKPPVLMATNIGCWRFQGRFTATLHGAGIYQGVTDTVKTTTVTFEHRRTFGGGPVVYYYGEPFSTVGGAQETVTWSRSGTDTRGCTHSGNSSDVSIKADDGFFRGTNYITKPDLALPDLPPRSYHGGGDTKGQGEGQYACPDGSGGPESGGFRWFLTPDPGQPTAVFVTADGKMAGKFNKPSVGFDSLPDSGQSEYTWCLVPLREGETLPTQACQ